MAFIESPRFPDSIAFGATMGPSFFSNIRIAPTGEAATEALWGQIARHRYEVGLQEKEQAETDALLAFFRAIGVGKWQGFRFKDWADYQCQEEVLGIGDGTTTVFQLIKTYTSDAASYVRTIVKPVADTLLAKVNGAVVSATMDTTTGLVTFANAPGIGAIVSASCEFDVPVRLDVDWLQIRPREPGICTWESIPLLEIRDAINVVDEGWASAASGQSNQAAIDTNGRLFTWGSAADPTNGYTGQTPVADGADYLPHAAIMLHGSAPSIEAWMLYPYEIGGGKTDWVQVQNQESNYMAIDAQGKLWSWGEGYYKTGGWGPTDKYDWNFSTGKFNPGGSTALVPTLVNNDTWSKFALGWYHVLGLKNDGSLWVWGTANYDSSWGNPGTYPGGSDSTTPIEMTWVPDPVKLVAADFDVSAIVTESDEVYIWGEFDSSQLGSIDTPTQLALTLPGGTTITQIVCSYAGVCVLLSNGDIYAAGTVVSPTGPPNYGSSTLELVSGGHIFTKVDMAHYNVGALDNAGTLWGWGDSTGAWLISRDNSFCSQVSYDQPVHIASPNPTGNTWIDFAVGGWTHIAINAAKEMYTWGFNAYGELGINEIQSSVNESCPPILTYPAVDASGNPAFP